MQAPTVTEKPIPTHAPDGKKLTPTQVTALAALSNFGRVRIGKKTDFNEPCISMQVAKALHAYDLCVLVEVDGVRMVQDKSYVMPLTKPAKRPPISLVSVKVIGGTERTVTHSRRTGWDNKNGKPLDRTLKRRMREV